MAARGPARDRRRCRPPRRARVPLRDVLLRHRVHPTLIQLPTSLEIDEARARWREIAGGNAGLGPIAAFHDQRLADLAQRPAPDVGVELAVDAADRAVRDGVPLLQAGRVSIDVDEAQAELRRVARNLAETAEEGTAAQRAAAALARADAAIEPLLGPALDGDRAQLALEAERLGVDPGALGELVDLALQPFLWKAAAQIAARTDLDRWDRGFCPVCAAWPALAELVGPEKKRVLRCVRCGSAWSWLVLLCPYCGNDDHRSLGTLQPEGSAQRVDTCERCHGYVKAIPSYSPSSALRLIAEDAVTLDLDVAATERGYTRPGTVDVATAGIPRLVREGRALPPPPSRPA